MASLLYRSLLLLWLLGGACVFGQDTLSRVDSLNLGLKMLLEDRRTRFETTDAVNALYDFRFPEADLEFRYLEVLYPDHPLPVYLIGLEEWWKIMPNEEDKSHDVRFLEQMDKTITKAQKMWNRQPGNLEAAFFLAGAYGFRGRLHADRHHWRQATLDGRAALKWLAESKGKENLSPEFLFGDALFNYYRQYIHENYPFLRPILAFFPQGDKAKGLDQLKTVSRNAFYTRTEAQTYLMRIYANEEDSPHLAYPLAEYLAGKFPHNAYFQRSYARLAYATGRLTICENVSNQILARVDSQQVGYEQNSLRYAAYFLGYIAMGRAYDSTGRRAAIALFDKSITAAANTESEKSGYTLYSLYYSGKLYQDLGDMATAQKRMEELQHRADKSDSAYKDAEAWLKKFGNKKKRFLFF